ncbi:hypothetical protein Y032_0028g1721 [Ancylostoma ceylanicum]|uniref:Uncharacterized protein n=1 Tax=Ancylostoma ceylanicum TaxID=53326 RepID=A0A016UTP9_9BILA|nr:hypothetical protein Y032_0028g1721 [Ancylostoma ceylanicum]
MFIANQINAKIVVDKKGQNREGIFPTLSRNCSSDSPDEWEYYSYSLNHTHFALAIFWNFPEMEQDRLFHLYSSRVPLFSKKFLAKIYLPIRRKTALIGE